MEMMSVPAIAPVAITLLFSISIVTGDSSLNQQTTLCAKLIRPWGYPCSDHTIETDDGYLLALQRVSSSSRTSSRNTQVNSSGPPVLLLHGLFMGGDAWFLNSAEQSLGFILADHGFDVWVGNVRGTRWSQGHVSLSEYDQPNLDPIMSNDSNNSLTPAFLSMTTGNNSQSLQFPNFALRLDRNNYSLWRGTIRSALSAYGLGSFLEFTSAPPKTIDVAATSDAPAITKSNPDYEVWNQRDQLLLLWIRSTLSVPLLGLVARATTIHDAWTTLERIFHAQTQSRQMHLRHQLQTMTKGSLSILEYYEKKRSIADSLLECLVIIPDTDLVSYIVYGLGPSYGSFRTALSMRDRVISSDELLGLLLQEEQRLEDELKDLSGVNNPQANIVSQSSTRQTPSRTEFDPSERPRPQCQICRRMGHEAANCYNRTNLEDYPAAPPRRGRGRGRGRGRDKHREQPTSSAHIASSSHFTPSRPPSTIDDSWYADSGASHHVTNDFSKLSLHQPYDGNDGLTNYWDWSWEDMALHDFPKMLSYVKSITSSKVFVVGHSQGTIMALAGFTQTKIVEMVQGAALLCPISYLEHVRAYLVLQMVSSHLDQMILAMNIYQLNFKSDVGVQLIKSVCDGHVECDNLLVAVTGLNCCFNNSRVGLYLENEPHPSSSKNLNHLFQMIRKGSFAKYDYGVFTNLKKYGHPQPPSFDLHQIPKSLPIWMGYGGNDALADMRDVQHTLSELQTKPEVLYIDAYGHIDFLLSVTAKADVYDHMIRFLSSHT